MSFGGYLMIVLYSYMFAKNETNFGVNLFAFIGFAVAAYFMLKMLGLFSLFLVIFAIVGREMSRQTSNATSIILSIIITIAGAGLWFI